MYYVQWVKLGHIKGHYHTYAGRCVNYCLEHEQRPFSWPLLRIPVQFPEPGFVYHGRARMNIQKECVNKLINHYSPWDLYASLKCVLTSYCGRKLINSASTKKLIVIEWNQTVGRAITCSAD